jgi:cellulose synthase/poly-beta-1,6-N-acetylglucosamine synthase-like glycosyltransferase
MHRWKKSMAVIFLIFNTGYVIICIIVVPTRTNHTMDCSLAFHYDAYHYSVIMSLLSGLFGCLILSIIVMYITIVCNMLWAFFFKVFSPTMKNKIFTNIVMRANGAIINPMVPTWGCSVVFVEFVIWKKKLPHRRPAASRWQTLWHNVVSSRPTWAGFKHFRFGTIMNKM